MGMLVSVFKGKYSSKDWKTLESEVGENLAGFYEDEEYVLWGSEIVKSLGLKIMPNIGGKNWVVVENDQLSEFETEVEIVQQNIKLIADHVTSSEYSIQIISNNILKAIKRAKEIENGGVIIW